MQNQFSRTQLLLGKPAIDTLTASRVAIFGVGGVGGYVAEVLARSGIGGLDLFDNDRICVTNINRQIYALISTIGEYKVDVAEERIHDINPNCTVIKHQMFYLPANADDVDLSQYDYVIDCIDTVTAKIELIKRCYALHIPIISCMGAANKMDPTAFRVTDINKTQMDPLAKIIRKKLRKLGIPRLKVVYSEETPLKPMEENLESNETAAAPHSNIIENDVSERTIRRRSIPASNAFVPAIAGLIAAGEVVKELINSAGTMRIIENS
jgi:tRNA A37 threonylcarbamoyladenosine dehydratase